MRPSVWAVAGPVCGREECGETSQGLPELSGEADPRDLRVWLLSTSYRKALTTAPQGLAMWRRNRGKAQDLYAALHLAAQSPGKGAASGLPGDVGDEAAALRAAFSAAMEDDLSLHRFWPAFSAFIKAVNGRLAAGGIGAGAERALAALEEVDAVLGILDREAVPLAEGAWSPEVRAIVREREEARAAKDFALADGLRERLCDHGFRLEDTPLGPRLFRANARQPG
jgi:cysteinyl-tRNA synthetase